MTTHRPRASAAASQLPGRICRPWPYLSACVYRRYRYKCRTLRHLVAPVQVGGWSRYPPARSSSDRQNPAPARTTSHWPAPTRTGPLLPAGFPLDCQDGVRPSVIEHGDITHVMATRRPVSFCGTFCPSATTGPRPDVRTSRFAQYRTSPHFAALPGTTSHDLARPAPAARDRSRRPNVTVLPSMIEPRTRSRVMTTHRRKPSTAPSDLLRNRPPDRAPGSPGRSRPRTSPHEPAPARRVQHRSPTARSPCSSEAQRAPPVPTRKPSGPLRSARIRSDCSGSPSPTWTRPRLRVPCPCPLGPMSVTAGRETDTRCFPAVFAAFSRAPVGHSDDPPYPRPTQRPVKPAHRSLNPAQARTTRARRAVNPTHPPMTPTHRLVKPAHGGVKRTRRPVTPTIRPVTPTHGPENRSHGPAESASRHAEARQDAIRQAVWTAESPNGRKTTQNANMRIGPVAARGRGVCGGPVDAGTPLCQVAETGPRPAAADGHPLSRPAPARTARHGFAPPRTSSLSPPDRTT